MYRRIQATFYRIGKLRLERDDKFLFSPLLSPSRNFTLKINFFLVWFT